MAFWGRFLELCFHSCFVVTVAKAAIECMCSTSDCLRDQKPSCRATYTCYVQYMAPAWTEAGNESVIRGCIDDSTPLLCENRRPQAFTGSWPVLHCCQDDWCNKDVMPTPPAWLQQEQDEKGSEKGSEYPDEGGMDSEEEDYIYNQVDNSQTQFDSNRVSRSRTINPLYVAVPVAGACVLLAIIIFAIFVLRRQNYMEEYRYPTTLSRAPPPNCCQDKKCMYTESERSSTGSETKLLMRV